MNKLIKWIRRDKVKFYNDLIREFIKLDQTYDGNTPYAFRKSIIWLNRALINCPDRQKKKKIKDLQDNLISYEECEFAYADLYL